MANFRIDPNAGTPDAPADATNGAAADDGETWLPADEGDAPFPGHEAPQLPTEPWVDPVTGKTVVPGAAYPDGFGPGADDLRFTHACCQAVRPNPEDPDGAVAEQVKEPYLVWKSVLKPTPAFGLWVGIGGVFAAIAALLAFLQLTIPMLIVAGLSACVALYLAGSLTVTSASLKHVNVEATRHVIEPKLERGKTFHMRLDTGATTVPGGLKITIRDLHSPGLRPVEAPIVDGIGRVHYKVRPQARGLLTFKGLDVRLASKNGLWIQDREYRLRTTVEVVPSLAAVALRSQLTGYVPFGLSAPQGLVKLYRDVEYELTRPFMAGDRMKDVNWKLAAKTGKMYIRRRWSDVESTILIVLDCSETMLMDQAGFRSIDLAVELAQELAQEGLRRNHEVGLLAFDSERIIDHVRPTRKKTQFNRVTEHLQFIADHHLPQEGEEPVEVLITGDPENLRMGMSQGIKQRNTASMSMIFMTDLQDTPDEIAQGIAKAAGQGQPVVVFLFPPPKLRPIRPGETAEDEKNRERRGAEHTLRLRVLLKAQGVEFEEVVIYPDEMDLSKPLPEEANDDELPPNPSQIDPNAPEDPKARRATKKA